MSFGAGAWNQHQKQGGWTNNGWGMPHHGWTNNGCGMPHQGWTNNGWDSGPQKAERQKAKVRLQAGVCIGCGCGIFVIGIVGLLILAANSWLKKNALTTGSEAPRGVSATVPCASKPDKQLPLIPPKKENISVTTHATWEIRDQGGDQSRVRAYTPRADHLRKTAGLLNQGGNETCELAAFARTVARMSVWFEKSNVRCEVDLHQFNATIEARAKDLFAELEKIAERYLGYERSTDGSISRGEGSYNKLYQGLSSTASLSSLWQQYLGCERIFVGRVPPGLALRVQRDVGVIFGVGSLAKHAVCLEGKGSGDSYTALHAYGEEGYPGSPDILLVSPSAPNTGDACYRRLLAEIVILPSWDGDEMLEGDAPCDNLSRASSNSGPTPTNHDRLRASISNWLNENPRAVVAESGDNLRLFSKDVRDNDDIVSAAAEHQFHHSALSFATERVRGVRSVVRKAVEQDGNMLEFASKDLKNDREIVLEAVKQTGSALRFASDTLKGDRELVLEAVRRGGALEFASENLRSDGYFQATARVRKDGMALANVKECLKEDVALVSVAIKQNGKALQFARGAARDDYGVQLDAFRKDPTVFVDVFRNDPGFIKTFLLGLSEGHEDWVIEAVERCRELSNFF